MKVQNSKRATGIDFLKLLAMLLIVISHTGPYYGTTYLPSILNLRLATTDIQNIVLSLYVYMGQIGNCIFLVCSAYFLLEKDEVKINKVIRILADCLFFSLAFLAVFLCAGVELEPVTVLKQFFPTTFEYCWFVGCYLLLYLIHPMLNVIVRSLTQKSLLLVNLAGVFLYSILQMVLRDGFYYTRMVGFILIYFLMAYSKMYLKNTSCKKKLNLCVLIVSTVLLVAMVAVTNVLGLYMDTFCEKVLHYCIFVNPFIILMAFSAFNLCKEWNIDNRVISVLASVTLYMYIIHENYLFANYARPVVFEYIYQTFTYEYVALWALLFAGICYVASLLLGLTYKYTLGRAIGMLCDKVAKGVNVLGEKCYEKLKRWN